MLLEDVFDGGVCTQLQRGAHGPETERGSLMREESFLFLKSANLWRCTELRSETDSSVLPASPSY